MFMTRGSLLRRDPSGTRSVLALSARGACSLKAWSAQCRRLPRTVCQSNVQILWSVRARTCPVLLADREQQQQEQHTLTPAPAQRRAHHCSVCGAARHTHRQACTHSFVHMHMHTHTHTQTHTHHEHAHTHTNTNARQYTQARTDTHRHMHTHKHTDTHACAHIYMHNPTGTHTRAHTHIHAHAFTPTHAYTRTHCARDGLRQFFSVASDAPSRVYQT